ncbi:MAG TPA: 3-phosphoshikimate 1-carboxyvinyltransferase [Gemmatimonadaceae bacterium]|nr:3-phosphoshikimate 1-carboxyvinyltransferase [Gemmatimonadaceae bacterium]
MTSRGVVRVPGDKSISHRALMLSAVASGESRISGILAAKDVQSTASVLRQLGVSVPDLSDDIRVEGLGLGGLKAPGSPVDAGNSGTTARLMSGILAAHTFTSRIVGDASLSARPMKRVAEPLTAMGARFEFAAGDGLPMTVHGGTLSGISWNTRSASAQVKSAILLAGLVARVPVSVREARKSRDHTERLLASLGAPVTIDGLDVSLAPVDLLAPLELSVPGDPSSAAYIVAAAILGKNEVEVPDVCLNPTRIGFLETLKRMGADIEWTEAGATAGDSIGSIRAGPGILHAVVVDPSTLASMIDELPLLACIAAGAGIALEVRNAAELRVKESDRIHLVVSNLRAIGAEARELPDGFVIGGGGGRLAGDVVTNGDHRIAMSFGVLSHVRGNDIRIDDRDCVAVSYPRFWADLDSLRR